MAPPEPVAFGAFSRGALRFEVDDGHTALDLEDSAGAVEFADEDLDAALLAGLGDAVPALAGAPLASWALARLACVAGGRLGFLPGVIELSDDPVFVVDLSVARDGLPVAKMQLQGGPIGLALLGVAVSAADARGVRDALLEALLEAPTALAPLRVLVETPERPGAPLALGWDAEGFHGRPPA